MIAPSRFTAEAFAGCAAPVSAALHPLSPRELPGGGRKRESAHQPFRVMAMLDFKSSVARKNPIGAIEAFERAFGGADDVELILKCQNGDAAPRLALQMAARAGPKVSVIDAVWPHDEVLALLASCDAFLSLHRAEGFGLAIAEAMQLGVPVITTDWSGSRDFTGGDVALKTPFRMTPALDDQGLYRGQDWADPDVGVAARHLRTPKADPAFAAALAERARCAVAEQLSPAAWFASLPEPLREALEPWRGAASPPSGD